MTTPWEFVTADEVQAASGLSHISLGGIAQRVADAINRKRHLSPRTDIGGLTPEYLARMCAERIVAARGSDSGETFGRQVQAVIDFLREHVPTLPQPAPPVAERGALEDLRERCAKACDALAVEFYNGDEAGGARCCAEAIRALPLTPDAPSKP